MHKARLVAVGVCLPRRRLSSGALVAACARSPRLPLARLTGIEERRVCGEGEDSRTLAIAAARDALRRAGRAAGELDALIYTGITKYDGDVRSFRREPAMSVLLAGELGADRALSFDVANACAGALTGLHILYGLVRRGVVRCGLVVSGEYISHLGTNAARNVDGPRHPEAASLTLGDSGAACVVERAPPGAGGILASVLTTRSEHVDLCMGDPCPSAPGARMGTDTTEIHAQGIGGTPAVVRRALEEAGLGFDDVAWVFMHQTSVQAIETCRALCAEQLGSDRPKWAVNVARVGNTASTAQLLALARCLAEGRLRPGDRVLLIAQASGLVLGAIVTTVDELVRRHAGSD
jgi:3-oxoacyl-[acyl-carrier-protein] synthase-3